MSFASLPSLVFEPDSIFQSVRNNNTRSPPRPSFDENSAPGSSFIVSQLWLLPYTLGVLLGIHITLHIIHYFIIHDAPPKGMKLLPGPRSTVPWVGRLHDVNPNAPWLAMTKFSKQYNGIFRSTISGEMHVWIGDPKIAHELLVNRGPLYASRPPVPAIPDQPDLGQYLPLLPMGVLWKKERTFAHTILADANSKAFRGHVELETRRMLYALLKSPERHFDHINMCCGRISTRLGYGRPDGAAEMDANAQVFIAQIGPSGSASNLLPFLNAFDWLIPSIKAVRTRRLKEKQLWKSLLDNVMQDWELGNDIPECYAHAWLKQRNSTKASENHDPSQQRESFGLDYETAIYAVGMMVTVAIFTISGPFHTILLHMMLFPKWQEKVRAEVDTVLNSSQRAPGQYVLTIQDIPKLPILRACILESLRWRPNVPLGVPRLLMRDDVLELDDQKYHLPKGAIIHAIDLALCRDPVRYPDPEAFRPERWLEAGWPTSPGDRPLTSYPRLQGHHGFGMGRRVCLGSVLAEAELVIGAGSIVGFFELGKVRDGDMDSYPWQPVLISGVEDFPMHVTPRKGKKSLLQSFSEGNEDLDATLSH